MHVVESAGGAHAHRFVGPTLAVIIVLLFAGCSAESSQRAELEALVQEKQWEEIRARVQLMRERNERGTWIDLAEGLALLHQHADRAAEPLFRRVIAADSLLAPVVAASYDSLAHRDLEAGWTDRARRRMVEAVRVYPRHDPGSLLDPVADYFFRFEKDYERAYPLYRRLYRERPDPPAKHREWVYRYGHCLEVLGFEESARAVYEEFIETWPDDHNYMRYVQWRYAAVLMSEAELARAQAQPVRALELLRLCVENEWHVDQQQRARYLSGQIEEDRGELHAARAWYEQVVEVGSSGRGRLVEQARARLDALGALGVH